MTRYFVLYFVLRPETKTDKPSNLVIRNSSPICNLLRLTRLLRSSLLYTPCLRVYLDLFFTNGSDLLVPFPVGEWTVPVDKNESNEGGEEGGPEVGTLWSNPRQRRDCGRDSCVKS